MIVVKENRQSLEQKIVELVSEYQALKIEQVEKYFGLPSETMAKAFRKLVKKGRISLDQEAGIIRESKDIREDMKLIRSFWLVLDFLDDCDCARKMLSLQPAAEPVLDGLQNARRHKGGNIPSEASHLLDHAGA